MPTWPLFIAYFALGEFEVIRGQMRAMAEAFDKAAEHGQRLGLLHIARMEASGRVEGPTPVPKALDRLDEQDAIAPRNALRNCSSRTRSPSRRLR